MLTQSSLETEEPLPSAKDYGRYRMTQRINPETGADFESFREYHDYRARKRINPDAKRHFTSVAEYDSYVERQRQKKLVNQEFGSLVTMRLKEMGKTHSWLANKLGVTRQSVTLYANGKSIPKGDSLKDLCFFLSPEYETLEDLV